MLSVNLETCMHSMTCSIATHPNGLHYYHVATLDLGALSSALSSPFVAQYKPEPEIQNRCHFEIMPLNGTTMRWMEPGVLLDAPFPPARKLPASTEEKARAKAECERCQQIVQIDRWIRDANGQLQPATNRV